MRVSEVSRVIRVLLVLALFNSSFAWAFDPPRMEPEAVLTYEQAMAIARRSAGRGGISAMSEITRELVEMVRIGGRAVRWADLVQQNIPEAEREQVWRRIDRIGNEATADRPMINNPRNTQQLWEEAMALTSPQMREVLEGQEDLPNSLPADTNLQDAMIAIRKINIAYSRASRWLFQQQWRGAMSKARRDLRPWLALKNQHDSLIQLIDSWSDQSYETQKSFVQMVSEACAIGGSLPAMCMNRGMQFAGGTDTAGLRRWFDGVYAGGERAYNEKFGVTHPHPGVGISQDGLTRVLTFFYRDIPGEIAEWMKTHVSAAWNFTDATRLILENATSPFQRGVVEVEWEAGTTPHVGQLGGNTITMDSNTPLWLELTQVTIAHEFGHIIGIPDCYVEFWDPTIESFVYYVLDPEDRMCALSGHSVDRHKTALLNAFHN